MSLAPKDLLDFQATEHAALFDGCQYAWEPLGRLGDYLKSNLKPVIQGKVSPAAVIEGPVFIGEGTVVEPHVYIKGPAWIGKECEIRQGAYLRGNVIAGDGCVLGNSCEFKNCLLFNEAEVPHFAYVGDSILGHHAHLGSGVTLSNLKILEGNVEVLSDGKRINTGLRKFGAIIGDRAQVGCHCVLNPGAVIGRGAVLYAGVSWRGVCAAGKVVKLRQEQVVAEGR
ncbi:MAG: UDP-N-acetylglucosamine diphosphorylase [Verrucomicrobiae bacterium]|nr:UDP-N-acetylglucosamine diphosphorylase [Verrucomicrobiae bacterium]